ncbi:YidB family protein [Spirochaetota bacterium]
MGLFDRIKDITGDITRNMDLSDSLTDGVTGIFKNMGMRGFIDSFRDNGLENVVKSWIRKGDNIPISSDQVKDVFGEDELEKISQKSGLPVDNVTDYLRDMLPDMINKVTPNGKIEEDDFEYDNLYDEDDEYYMDDEDEDEEYLDEDGFDMEDDEEF